MISIVFLIIVIAAASYSAEAYFAKCKTDNLKRRIEELKDLEGKTRDAVLDVTSKGSEMTFQEFGYLDQLAGLISVNSDVKEVVEGILSAVADNDPTKVKNRLESFNLLRDKAGYVQKIQKIKNADLFGKDRFKKLEDLLLKPENTIKETPKAEIKKELECIGKAAGVKLNF